MSKADITVILGSSDAEMTAIERECNAAGLRVAYAVGSDGKRVHPGNAYQAVGYTMDGQFYDVARCGTAWLVECDIVRDGFGEGATIVRIDHHRPGDAGYGRGPEDFLAASSIGQVVAELCRLGLLHPEYADNLALACERGDTLVDEDRAIVFAAAADHCLEAAYRGRCPGVDPDALMRWRAESRAAFQGRTVEAVLTDVETARQRLKEAVAHVYRDGVIGTWADLRGQSIPELPEAAAREGIAFLATVRDRDGREKVVLQAATPELVTRFLAGEIVPGLKDVYGDPARGFAGGYKE